MAGCMTVATKQSDLKIVTQVFQWDLQEVLEQSLVDLIDSHSLKVKQVEGWQLRALLEPAAYRWSFEVGRLQADTEITQAIQQGC